MWRIKIIWQNLNKKLKISILGFVFLAILAALFELVSILAIVPLMSYISSGKLPIIDLVSSGIIKKAIGNLNGNSIIIIFVCLLTISALFRLYVLRLSNLIANEIGSYVGHLIFKKYLHEKIIEKSMTNVSERITLLTTQLNTFISYNLQPFFSIVISINISIFIIFSILIINLKIALSVIIIMVSIYFALTIITKKLLLGNSEYLVQTQNSIYKLITESLTGSREVILYNLQKRFSTDYSIQDKKLKRVQAINLFIAGSPRYIIEAIGIIGVSILAFVIPSVNSKDSIVFLGSFAFAAQKLLPTLQQIFSAWSGFKGSRKTFEVITDELGRLVDEVSWTNDRLNFNNKIELQNIFFEISEL